jgi:hypothetical protein
MPYSFKWLLIISYHKTSLSVQSQPSQYCLGNVTTTLPRMSRSMFFSVWGIRYSCCKIEKVNHEIAIPSKKEGFDREELIIMIVCGTESKSSDSRLISIHSFFIHSFRVLRNSPDHTSACCGSPSLSPSSVSSGASVQSVCWICPAGRGRPVPPAFLST